MIIIGYFSHSRAQRLRSFRSAPRIATSGQVQRHSSFEWICKHNRLRPEPIRFLRLDSEYAQSDRKSMNRGLPLLDLARGPDFQCMTKGTPGDEVGGYLLRKAPFQNVFIPHENSLRCGWTCHKIPGIVCDPGYTKTKSQVSKFF